MAISRAWIGFSNPIVRLPILTLDSKLSELLLGSGKDWVDRAGRDRQ
jgi:hypothetical protein